MFREPVELEAEPAEELEVGRRSELLRPVANLLRRIAVDRSCSSAPRSGQSPRSRRPRSGSFAIVGRSIRYPIDSPSTRPQASPRARDLLLSARQVPVPSHPKRQSQRTPSVDPPAAVRAACTSPGSSGRKSARRSAWLEPLLETGEVEIALFVERREKTIRLGPVRLEIDPRRGPRHRGRRIRPCAVPRDQDRASHATRGRDRRREIRARRGHGLGGSRLRAAYDRGRHDQRAHRSEAPHRLRGRPRDDGRRRLVVAARRRRRRQRAVSRARVAHGPQVLVPLRDGSLALGTYQVIFFASSTGRGRASCT